MSTQVINEYHYLDGKTYDVVRQQVKETIYQLDGIPLKEKQKHLEKLIGYRYVEDLCDFQRGKIGRWIHKETGKMKSGIQLDLKFNNKGTNVVSKFFVNHQLIQYPFDDYFTYQKIYPEEHVILSLNSV